MRDKQKAIFNDTIRILFKLDLLEHLILIGSWAEYIYQQTGYFEGFVSNFKTTDLDFLIPNIKKPNRKVNLCDAMERAGFLMRVDSINGLTKFYQGEGPLELEFIARELGSGQVGAYTVENLGIRVEGLRHLNVLAGNAIPVLFQSYIVKVPRPQAYVLHKLIINNRRPEYKKVKDLSSVENLLDYIKQSVE